MALTPFQKTALHVALRGVSPGHVADTVRDYLRTYPQDRAQVIEAVREMATTLNQRVP